MRVWSIQQQQGEVGVAHTAAAGLVLQLGGVLYLPGANQWGAPWPSPPHTRCWWMAVISGCDAWL